MFFLGRKSEKEITPKVALDMASSFEGGTRWTSHFHMPTLLSIDISRVPKPAPAASAPPKHSALSIRAPSIAWRRAAPSHAPVAASTFSFTAAAS